MSNVKCHRYLRLSRTSENLKVGVGPGWLPFFGVDTFWGCNFSRNDTFCYLVFLLCFFFEKLLVCLFVFCVFRKLLFCYFGFCAFRKVTFRLLFLCFSKSYFEAIVAAVLVFFKKNKISSKSNCYCYFPSSTRRRSSWWRCRLSCLSLSAANCRAEH